MIYTLLRMTLLSAVKPCVRKIIIVPGFLDIDPKLEAYKHYLKSKIDGSLLKLLHQPSITVYSWIENLLLCCKKLFMSMF